MLKIAGLLCLALALFAQRGAPPYSPRDALKTFRIVDGFQIELFAAEPLVADPVAMEVDEQGRLFVVEMPGYPLDVGGSGRVVVLEDTDRNGLPDRRIVFADGLKLPTGIMRWQKGVIVTDSPDVLYLEDTNGDGRADVRRVMITGFALTNPQHTTNTPIYGLDNWIYLANEGPTRTLRYGALFGDEGSAVHFPDRPTGPRLPPDADGRNVRFRPDTWELEALSSRSQFGQTFDEWGRHFLNTNNRHLYQEVIAARYLARNPALVIPSVIEQLPDYRLPAEVFPITENPRFELLTDVGVMTSACGLTYYLADLFPPAYRNAAFVAEGAHNLVHVASVRDHGVTFKASRMHEGREFLASTDPWFRPVNFYIGPDGALYLLDYYRRFFEHPEWMDEATAKSGALYEGKDKGRIYRITPRGTAAAAWLASTRLGDAPLDELVRRLGDPNIWWRRHAQRLLVDRKAAESFGPLIAVATSGESPVGRVHALWTLQALGQITPGILEMVLGHPVAGVRENAIRVAEASRIRLPAARIESLAADADPKVRFQLLLTLGDDDGEVAQRVRRDLLVKDVEDEWMQAAALSAARLDATKLLPELAAKLAAHETPGRRTLFTRLGAAIGAGSDLAATRETILYAFSTAGRSPAWWRAATLDGISTGLRGAMRRSAELDTERSLLANSLLYADPLLRRAEIRLLETIGGPPGGLHAALLRETLGLATDAAADADTRVDAIRLLVLDGADKHEAQLRGFVERAEPAAVQLAAVRALGGMKGERAATLFIDFWDRWTPAVRDEAMRQLVIEPARVRLLLDAVASRKIRMSEIDRPLRIRMMMNADDRLRTRARELFAESPAASTAVVARYARGASAGGDRTRGRDVFTRVCSTCHLYRGGSGSAYGPDLGEVRSRLPMSLVTDILVPNHSIADGYELWTVQLADGSTIGGIIGAETPTSVTFRLPGGAERTVARSEITSMRIAEVSAMPEGLESQIDVRQMADLIAFIKGG